LTRTELKQQLKTLLVEGLKLEEIQPADIIDHEPIFVEGLGLDSIDALELVVLVEERFGVTIPDEEVGKIAFASFIRVHTRRVLRRARREAVVATLRARPPRGWF
jgi:acyl carrier protein